MVDKKNIKKCLLKIFLNLKLCCFFVIIIVVLIIVD